MFWVKGKIKVKSSGQECPPHTSLLYPGLRSFGPSHQAFFLLRCQTVDLDADRLQLQLRYVLVKMVADAVLSG
jgi:hypothetical protein